MLPPTQSLRSGTNPGTHQRYDHTRRRLVRTQAVRIAIFVLGWITASSMTVSPWHPMRWMVCDTIVIPWHVSVQTAVSTLRRNGIMGVQRRGVVTQGTLSLQFRDEERGEAIEMVFDTRGRFIGASTEHRTETTEGTKAFVHNTIGRLVVAGGRIRTRRPTSTDLALACNGTSLTLTIAIDPDRPLVALLTVMVERDSTSLLAD